jgi:hypothetical protein
VRAVRTHVFVFCVSVSVCTCMRACVCVSNLQQGKLLPSFMVMATNSNKADPIRAVIYRLSSHARLEAFVIQTKLRQIQSVPFSNVRAPSCWEAKPSFSFAMT